MGGIGSGAKRSSRVGNVEDVLAFDIRVLRRLGVMRPGECVIDTLQWSFDGLRTASVHLRADLSDIEHADVAIDVTVPTGAIAQRIAVSAVPSSYGGHRFYFICPISGRRCEVLYLSQGRFASRSVHRLSFASQNTDDLTRARRRAAKLRSRLKGECGFGAARGRRRIELAEKAAQAEQEAHALYIDKLHAHTNRSGTRRMPGANAM